MRNVDLQWWARVNAFLHLHQAGAEGRDPEILDCRVHG